MGNMNFLYAADFWSEKKLSEHTAASNIKRVPQAQKYNRLLAEVLAANDNVKVTVLSGMPTTTSKRLALS